jgi:hypothetical protein
MPFVRSTVPGASSYGTRWPEAGSVAEVSDTEAAELLRIDPARFSVVPAEELSPPAAAAEEAEAREVTEPAPSQEFSESPVPRKGRRGKPVTEDSPGVTESK